MLQSSRFLVLFALVGLLGTTPLAAAQEAQGGISIGLAEAPTNRADDPRAKIYIVDHVAPGTTLSRRLRVKNDSNTSQSVDTYAAAASVTAGEFRFGTAHARNELTTWTTVDPAAATYAAGEEKLARVTIAVPANASPGERYAVVWASVASTGSGGISAVNRVGVRVYLSVGPGGEPPSDFKITGVAAQRTADGVPQVVARVKNTGGRAVDLSGSLQLDGGPGGLAAGPLPIRVGVTLGVGESEPLVANLDKALPAGPWKATVTLESGLTKRHATQTLTFPTASTTAKTTGHKSSVLWFILAAALLAVAVFVAVCARVWSRRRTVAKHASCAPDLGR